MMMLGFFIHDDGFNVSNLLPLLAFLQSDAHLVTLESSSSKKLPASILTIFSDTMGFEESCAKYKNRLVHLTEFVLRLTLILNKKSRPNPSDLVS